MPRFKVKTGCRTCKIRKIKCDEGRPACRRCMLGGRTCDGYGIWDGPPEYISSSSHSHQQAIAISSRQPNAVSLLLSCSFEEREYVDWFLHRTITKLPGTFVSPFWTTLILQASSSEPAVFHAILALVSVHKEGTIASEVGLGIGELAIQQISFSIQHYISALAHLKACFSGTDKRSIRVILITCLSFICVDLLLGHFESSQMHVTQGFEILNACGIHRDDRNSEVHISPHRDLIDDWIVEAFSRLRFMRKLFGGQPCSSLGCIVTLDLAIRPYNPSFSSFRDAWQELQRLFDKIFCLVDQSHFEARTPGHDKSNPSRAQLEFQHEILVELDQWLAALQAFLGGKPSGISKGAEKAGYLLNAYYHMASIMSFASVYPDDEMIFDTCTDKFTMLLDQLSLLRFLVPERHSSRSLPGLSVRLDRSITDLGWIAPLYYTAVKCRVRHVRQQAIEFLTSSPHREGFWDAKVMGCIAEKVVQLEEQAAYKGIPSAGDINSGMSEDTRLLRAQLSILPKSSRYNEIEVALLGSPLEKIHLTRTQRGTGISPRVSTSTYDVRFNEWKDAEAQDIGRYHRNESNLDKLV